MGKYCNSGTFKKLQLKGLLDPKTTVYFKGAYTIFPNYWREPRRPDRMNGLSKEDIMQLENGEEQYKIYQRATTGLLIFILKLLRKRGMKTLIADPEPGYHPSTAKLRDDEKKKGLIEIYKGFGMTEIKCDATIMGMKLAYSKVMSIREVKIESNLDPDSEKSMTVMVGDIGEMMKKIEFARGFIGRFLERIGPKLGQKGKKLSGQIKETYSFDNVPVFGTTNQQHNLLNKELFVDYNREQPDAPYITDKTKMKSESITIPNEPKPIIPLDKNLYKQKYIKYKTKYNNLKKKYLSL